ncbi:hypothetical protein BS50DRAFT_575742 [Corynespora cassiicola Philippines]|uniref:Uncharacterized protein n=1 Tax=Corynespora cassiicola Philippines TaxID=1448308 RepID=A0A2T2NFT1_CORCC|nr:hypothetical protein BS50DRAFT_575742 [Corynespora cassiicola Philippines]
MRIALNEGAVGPSTGHSYLQRPRLSTPTGRDRRVRQEQRECVQCLSSHRSRFISGVCSAVVAAAAMAGSTVFPSRSTTPPWASDVRCKPIMSEAPVPASSRRCQQTNGLAPRGRLDDERGNGQWNARSEGQMRAV